jgi:putative redox protein
MSGRQIDMETDMVVHVDFPGGARVDAHFNSHTVATDQPPYGGGEGTAPTPFETFLASVAACAGIYVLNFCRQRAISAEGVRLTQYVEKRPDCGLAGAIRLYIELPRDFPVKYRAAIVRAAEQCLVKRQFESPPEFEVRALFEPEPASVA